MDARGPTNPARGDLSARVITIVEGGTVEHWAVIQSGTRRKRTVIGHAAEVVRQARPHVNG